MKERIKKKKKEKISTISWIALTISLLSLMFGGFMFLNNTYFIDEFSYREVKFSPIPYLNDEAVLNVTAICEGVAIKSRCVFDEIPFKYTNRSSEEGRLIIPPVELYQDGEGICRDIALFRMAVLTNLKVSASYVFEPNHVFIITYEERVAYELNNGVFIERLISDIDWKE